jgi:hypothetical protein
MSNQLTEATKAGFSLAPQNIDEALRFAEMLSKSNLVPKDFQSNPGNILVAVQWGMELGLQPMQSMQNIAVINGRPSLWGDAVIALVKASPACEYIIEEVTETSASCKVKRHGEPEQVRYFTVEDAKKAGLWGKQGPWTNYPKRMMQMRARSWALRDVFPDVLRGMPIAEEVQDMQEEKDVSPEKTAENKTPDARPILDGATFKLISDKYKQSVVDGKKTVADFIAWVENKGSDMTEDQKKEVNSWVNSGPTTVEGESSKVDDSFVTDMEAAEGVQ